MKPVFGCGGVRFHGHPPSLPTRELPRRATELLFVDAHLPDVVAARAAGGQAGHFTGVAGAPAARREHGPWSNACSG